MEVVYRKIGVGNWYGLRQLAAELVFSNLSEIQFIATKLVFSAWRNPWAVAGCSLLDATQFVSAVYA